jgi:hypothetical protein
MSKSPNRFVPSGKLKALELREGSSIPVSNALSGRIRYNEVTNHLELSENTGAFASILGTEHGIVTLTPLGGGADDAPQIAAAIATGKIVILAAGTWVRGAVTRTSTHAAMFDPASGVHNVEFYGALGDGVVDDTVAIQAAIDAAVVVGGKVFLPAGKYLTTSTLNMHTGAIEVYGVGFACAGQARYAAAAGTYDTWYRDHGTMGHGTGLCGTVIWVDGCNGFTWDDRDDPYVAGMIFRDFAIVSKGGSGDWTAFENNTHAFPTAYNKYINVCCARWWGGFDLFQYHGEYWGCYAHGCLAAFRSGAKDVNVPYLGGNDTSIVGFNAESCDAFLRLFDGVLISATNVLFQNGLYMIHAEPNSQQLGQIHVSNVWYETLVPNNRALYFDVTDAHGGDVRSLSTLSLSNVQVSGGSVDAFEFVHVNGWWQLAQFTLRNFDHLTGISVLPEEVTPVLVENGRFESLSADTDAKVFVSVFQTPPAGRLVRANAVSTTSGPSETTGSSWMVGKKITFAMSPYTVGISDSMLLVDTTGGAVRLVLGHVATNDGRHLNVVDWASNASVNDISIEAEAGETVDGAADIHLVVDGSAAHLYCDGLEYRTIPHV